MKKYLLYLLKWQGGTPIMALVLWLLPINNMLIKTIIANVIGAIIFFPVDNWIFGRNKKETPQINKLNDSWIVGIDFAKRKDD